GSQFGINAIGRLIERQHIEPRQNLVDTPGEPHRTTLGGAKAQFGGDDNAGQNISLAALAGAPRDRTLTASHKVRDDVRVEQVAHQMSTGSGGGSSISGKASSSPRSSSQLSVSLDPTRVEPDAGRIADEVIVRLAGLVGHRSKLR